MLPLDGLVSKFQALADQNAEVHLLNAYRGVPVIHSARVLKAKRGSILLEVHPEQAVCINLEGQTSLLAGFTHHTLQASAAEVDLLENLVNLTGFQRTKISIGKRMQLRVQPDAPVELQIGDGERTIAAQLVDISVSGIGVTVPGPSPEEVRDGRLIGMEGWYRGQLVQIDLGLPDGEARFRCKARIVNMFLGADLFSRKAGLRIVSGLAGESALKGYIAVRQSETMAELHRLHESLCREQGAGPPLTLG